MYSRAIRFWELVEILVRAPDFDDTIWLNIFRWVLHGAAVFMVLGVVSWGLMTLRVRVIPLVSLQTLHHVTTVLLPLSASLGLVFYLVYRTQARRIRQQKMLTERLRDTQQSLSKRNRELQTSVEFLSAAREISLILNEQVEEEAILERVLHTTARLLDEEFVKEISIYTPEEDETSFQNRAQWEDQTVHIGDNVSSDLTPSDERFVRKTFDHGQLFTLMENEQFIIFIPLAADREKNGVLKIVFASRHRQERISDIYETMKPNLLEYSKIVALAIKTPDLYTRTIKDSLTGLYSKRHLMNQLETHVSLSRRHGEPLSIIFLDLDHFKELNDTYGHEVGDRVLKAVGSYIQNAIREYTSGYRYGGEEIVILAPRTDREGARRLADRLREGVSSLDVKTDEGEALDITASFGVTTTDGSEMIDPEDLLDQADQALYASKEGGRNQVSVYE